MSATIVRIGNGSAVFGVQPQLPLKGFPAGRIKIRMRNDCFATAFVKTHDGIRKFIIAEDDGHWVPSFEQGANIRTEVIA